MRKLLLLSAVLALISVSVFLFFKAFALQHLLNDYRSEILAAFLGTIFTVIITQILLQSQSAADEAKGKALGIFEAKLKLYSEFLDFLNDIIEDEVISGVETRQLKKWCTRLALIGGPELVCAVVTFVDVLTVTGKFRCEDFTDEDRKKWATHLQARNQALGCDPDEDCDPDEETMDLASLIGHVKQDLGEEKVSDEKSVNLIYALLSEMLMREDSPRPAALRSETARTI